MRELLPGLVPQPAHLGRIRLVEVRADAGCRDLAIPQVALDVIGKRRRQRQHQQTNHDGHRQDKRTARRFHLGKVPTPQSHSEKGDHQPAKGSSEMRRQIPRQQQAGMG